MKIEVPGKVFLIGEYSCLWGAASVIATTASTFSLSVSEHSKKSNALQVFAEQSPAGKLLHQNASRVSQWNLDWKLPHSGRMGIGSSSAEFISAFLALHPTAKPFELWKAYRKIAHESGQIPPSGLDVFAQALGGVHVFRGTPPRPQALKPWKDSKSAWVLFWTGSKIKTHEHLKKLGQAGLAQMKKKQGEELGFLGEAFVRAWSRQSSVAVGFALNAFQHCLEESLKPTSSYANSIRQIQETDGVYGCKGAGAQGGDCLVALVQRSKLASVERVAAENRLRLIEA